MPLLIHKKGHLNFNYLCPKGIPFWVILSYTVSETVLPVKYLATPPIVTVCSACACHSTSLCRLRCAVVAAESLTIYVVVIVLTVIRLVKRLVIFLDSLQLLAIFFLVVHRQNISFIACIRYSPWVCLLCSPIYAAFLILLQNQS